MEIQKAQNSKTNHENEEQRFKLSTFKTQYVTTEIKTVRYVMRIATWINAIELRVKK